MIIVTGAAGFIGSCLVSHLNSLGHKDLILVDAFGREDKERNLAGKSFVVRVERDQLFDWLEKERPSVSFCFHFGARTDTTEFDYAVHERLNLEYSKKIWDFCTASQVPLVYASSAATYGDGGLGYEDDHALIPRLKPLNPYGISKNEFDKWVLLQKNHPPFWAGLKFFNVYGPNEYHKGRMASVIFHGYHQMLDTGEIRLFRSHRPDFKDGEQLRDFIYVKDILKVSVWLMRNQQTVPSAIYNLGTGKARSFKDLAEATFRAQGKVPNIRFIDMPDDLREKYQYFTEANMEKLHLAGYREPFFSLEEGVKDYVAHYLATGLFY